MAINWLKLFQELLLCVTTFQVILHLRRFGSDRDLVNHQVPFAFYPTHKLCAILSPRWLGSNRDLVNHQVPFASPQHFFIHKIFIYLFSLSS